MSHVGIGGKSWKCQFPLLTLKGSTRYSKYQVGIGVQEGIKKYKYVNFDHKEAPKLPNLWGCCLLFNLIMCDYNRTSLMMYNLFQMVDRLDDGTIPADLGPLDYKGLYKVIWCRSFCKHYIWLDIYFFIFTIGTTFRLLEKLFSGHM